MFAKKESFGDVVSVAGALGAGGGAGIVGYMAGRRIADQSMNREIDQSSTPPELNKAMDDPHNLWVPVEEISSIVIKKGLFVHKLTVTLRNGTTLFCGSKAGYRQIDNIRNYLTAAFPTLVQEA